MAFLLFRIRCVTYPSLVQFSLGQFSLGLCKDFVGQTILKIPTRFINVLVIQIFFVLEVYVEKYQSAISDLVENNNMKEHLLNEVCTKFCK